MIFDQINEKKLILEDFNLEETFEESLKEKIENHFGTENRPYTLFFEGKHIESLDVTLSSLGIQKGDTIFINMNY